LSTAPLEAIQGGTAEENAAIIRNVLSGAGGPRRDVVLLNAAAALYAAEMVETIPAGIAVAAAAIDSGAARRTLERLVEFTQNPVLRQEEQSSRDAAAKAARPKKPSPMAAA
jgi:anthranilate phosphoribosyltransferase